MTTKKRGEMRKEYEDMDNKMNNSQNGPLIAHFFLILFFLFF